MQPGMIPQQQQQPGMPPLQPGMIGQPAGGQIGGYSSSLLNHANKFNTIHGNKRGPGRIDWIRVILFEFIVDI